MSLMDYDTLSTKYCSCHRGWNMLWLNRKKRLFLLGGVAILIIFIILISSLAYTYVDTVKCDTEECIAEAYRFVPIKDSLDLSVDPCTDFYTFSCGKWGESRNLPDDKYIITTFDVLQHKVDQKMQFIINNTSINDELPHAVKNTLISYQSCINRIKGTTMNLKPLMSLFQQIGGWPIVIGQDWNEDGFNWTKASAQILQTVGIHTLIGVYVSVDDKNTSRNLIYLDQPLLPVESVSDNTVQEMIFAAVRVLSANQYNESDLFYDIRNVSEIEQIIRQMRRSSERDLFISKAYRKMTILQLQKEIPQLEWLHFIQSVTNKSLHLVNSYISETEEIVLLNIEYLKNIVGLLQNGTYSNRTIANYIGWLVIQDLYITIPGVFEMYAESADVTAKEMEEAVKRLCFKQVSKNLGLFLDYLFVKHKTHFSKKNSSELLKYMKNAFRKLVVQEADWLDHETKISVFLKLNTMSEVVGYPNILENPEKLDEKFKNFPNMTSNSLENFLMIKYYSVENEIFRLRLFNDKKSLLPPRPTTTVGAYYMLRWNTIVFPMAIHDPPFYYNSGPWYLNFGAIGAIIGHEITHGFDNQGHERDEFGNLRNWWSNTSLENYKQRSLCFREQFNNYEIPETKFKVNGDRTLGENIADSGGLRQAYIAYKNWEKTHGIEKRYPGLEQYTPDQMFFISFASVFCAKVETLASKNIFENDIHSPQKFRVIGSVSNSDHFSKVFNCKKGSPMNPENKCSLW